MLHAEVRLALAHVDRARGNAAEQVHSHADLLALLERGDLEAAADELAEHLGGAEDSMVEAVGRNAVPDAARHYADAMKILIRLVVNVLALGLAVWLFDGITLTGDNDTDRSCSCSWSASSSG